MERPWPILVAAACLSLGAPALAADATLADAAPTDPNPDGCIDISSSPAQKAEAARRVTQAMLPPEVSAAPTDAPVVSGFAPDLAALSNQNVFGNLWGRCGLSRRDRSLVTLGMLMALRAERELRFHFPAAVRNGVSRRELEEVIYQASGYAGFPAAALARRVADETLGK